jgi:hypothetical protein
VVLESLAVDCDTKIVSGEFLGCVDSFAQVTSIFMAIPMSFDFGITVGVAEY